VACTLLIECALPDILLVDDDDGSCALVRAGLEDCGHRVEVLAWSAEAAKSAARLGSQIVILAAACFDPTMKLCELRRSPATRSLPVLVIARSADERARIQAFEAGADDVVVQPFSMRELCLRIRVLVKWRSPRRPAVFECGLLRVDLDARRAFVALREVELTRREFSLLAKFCTDCDRELSRDTLFNGVWGTDVDMDGRIVDVYVGRLKLKLGPAARYIRSIRGVGYRLDSYRHTPK